MGNYIKIDRKILEWEWWADINTYRLFTYMLIRANWKEGDFKGVHVPRGSFVSTLSKLSEATNLTVDEIRTALKHLKSTKEITSKSHGKFTVFTVNNYDQYQDVPTQPPDQIPNTSHSIPELFPAHRRREEGEEEKEGKKYTPLYPPGGERGEAKPEKRETQKQILDRLLLEIQVPDCLLEHIEEWLEYKKERHFAYKERGLKTLLRQASENARRYGDEAVARAISDSIANGYQGIIWEKAEKLGRNNAVAQNDEPSESSNEDEGNSEELVGDDW